MAFNEHPSIMFSFPGAGLIDQLDATCAHVIIAEFSACDYYLILCAMDKTQYNIPVKVIHSLVINGDLPFQCNEDRRSVLIKGLNPFKFDFPDMVNYWAFVKALTEAKLIALEMSARFEVLHQDLVHAVLNIPAIRAAAAPKDVA